MIRSRVLLASARLLGVCAAADEAAPAPASEPEPTPAPSPVPETGGKPIVTFSNCDAMRAVYPDGVAREGTTGNVISGNVISGKLRPFTGTPVFDTPPYEANTGRDWDRDGTACER